MDEEEVVLAQAGMLSLEEGMSSNSMLVQVSLEDEQNQDKGNIIADRDIESNNVQDANNKICTENNITFVICAILYIGLVSGWMYSMFSLL